LIGLLNVGFGNMINSTKLVAVINPDSAPAKRLVQTSRDDGRVIDATQGRRTRAVLIMDDDHIVLSALQPETLAGRFKGREISAETVHDVTTRDDEAEESI